ncbi:Phosphoenolpyruvate/pyruvate domain-containing protein [Linderina pennispora]|uniref:Phosphoenolpyruvate/pyruvate domain-containing protein n=1 Tax=Linderina pennispora TaxID=61395 RepID=A0A1Y1W565_9FUNG|nr:Phosphoenolpyruvate/pyruvate domain-containing protein [Linderina pennispora]ORX68495.1 Phosphoenolpyruvate/pyruvate domain-containing protein [Linderina pennispora]
MYSPSGGHTPPPLNSARLKARLRDGVPAFGVWLSIPSPVTARMVAAQGFDWACIDMEHSPLNPTLMAEMVAAVASTGTCAPIVRVPSHSPEYFKWALDAGAHGVIVPMVNTRDEMIKVIGHCKYPPEGRRSYGAFYAPQSFGIRGPGAMGEYAERANHDILVIPQIESAEAVSNVADILSVSGIDAIFVGPFDMQASLGIQRPVEDSYDSRFLAAQSAVIQAAEARNIPRGIYTSSGAAARSKLGSRYTLLVAANDLSCLMRSTSENLGRAKSDPRAYR